MAVLTRAEPNVLRCMEIHGNFRAVEEAVILPGLDGWIRSQPHEGSETGGDVHYVSLCGGGIVTRLVLADVSGHGSVVAEFSSALRGLLRSNINTKSQTRLVGELNRQFGEATGALRFATAVVMTYLAHERSLTVCNAGHPRPLWFRAATRGWTLLDADLIREGNLPLGLDDDSPYHQFSVTLGPGDLVILYTDALIESKGGDGTLLMEEGLLRLARGLNTTEAPPEEVGRALLSAVAGYRDGHPADDDETILVLRHNGGGPKRLSLGERLEVYAKVFGLKSY